MLKLVFKGLLHLRKDSPGASLLELSVSLLVMSIAATGFTGAVAVGATVSNKLEDRSVSLVTVGSEAEFILSHPTASSYPNLPSALPDVIITADATDECLGRLFLQCLSIQAARGTTSTADATLETYKADRFVSIGPASEDQMVPASGGVERVKVMSAPNLPKDTGFAVVVSKVFGSAKPTDLLVRWEVHEGDSDNSDDPRTIAIYEGTPFGAQTGDITTDPLLVPANLVAIGQIGHGDSDSDSEDNIVLSVGAREVALMDHTIYLFNSSNKPIQTDSLEVTCACEIAS